VKIGDPLDVPVGDALGVVRVPLSRGAPGWFEGPGAGETLGVTDGKVPEGGRPGVDPLDAAGGAPADEAPGT
jgi:hypothetical protein